MLPLLAIITYFDIDHDYRRFYAQAEVILSDAVDRAELRLKSVNSSVHAAPLFSARAGVNTFYISGIGASPFEVGETIPISYTSKKRIP